MHWVGWHKPQDLAPSPQHPAPPAQSHAWAPDGNKWWQKLGGFWNFPIALSMWAVVIPEIAKIPSLVPGASILIYNSGHTHDTGQVQPLTLSQAVGPSLSIEKTGKGGRPVQIRNLERLPEG